MLFDCEDASSMINGAPLNGADTPYNPGAIASLNITGARGRNGAEALFRRTKFTDPKLNLALKVFLDVANILDRESSSIH